MIKKLPFIKKQNILKKLQSTSDCVTSATCEFKVFSLRGKFPLRLQQYKSRLGEQTEHHLQDEDDIATVLSIDLN